MKRIAPLALSVAFVLVACTRQPQETPETPAAPAPAATEPAPAAAPATATLDAATLGGHHWKLDQAVDAMARLPATDPRFRENYLKAMEIWLAELPTLPTVKWYLRVPFNTTYWQGWPTEANPYVGGGSWHRGAAGVIIHALTPA